MKFKVLKYLVPFVLFVGAICSFKSYGIVVWLPLVLVWIIIPLLEFFIDEDAKNMTAAEEELVSADRTYDFILYLIVPLQYVSLYFFFNKHWRQQSQYCRPRWPYWCNGCPVRNFWNKCGARTWSSN